MSRLWQTLETLPGPAAVPAVWKAGLGDEFDRYRSAFLRTRPKPAMSYPCPHDCGCAHEIVRHKSGKIVAVCQCDPSSCNDIPLTESDCVVLELNWSALGRSVAAALGLTGREADLGVRDALQIAVSGGHALPVVLVICNDREAFLHAVEALLARLGGSFMVVAPTADFVDGSVQQLFSGANARFVPLDRSVRISDTGVMSPIESASGPGVSKKRGWDGLRIGEIFEPQTMLWNGKPFQIEEPAACFKGYDLENVSLESYFPDLNDNWHEAIKDVPFDEVENLRVLRLIGFDKTLEIQIMLKDSVPVYPERLESSGETDGWHEGGVLFVFGEAFHIKGLRVEPTEPTVQAKIGAARRARGPVCVTAVAAAEPMLDMPEHVGRSMLEVIHDDIKEIRAIAAPLPAAVAKVDRTVEMVHKHVRGVPILQAELADAQRVPESLAVEIHKRISDILTVDEQAIWYAMRRAGGCQKDAIPLLQESGISMSTSTLCRRVKLINPKLLANNLPACDAASPATRFKKHGGFESKDGDLVPEELSAVETDWAADPTERDTTIQAYLAASPEDQEYFRQTKPGIQDEGEKYLKRRR